MGITELLLNCKIETTGGGKTLGSGAAKKAGLRRNSSRQQLLNSRSSNPNAGKMKAEFLQQATASVKELASRGGSSEEYIISSTTSSIWDTR